MDELGYDIEWQIFNSKYHSVPQNRERVYTVGHLRSRGRKQIFPLRGADEEDNICRVEQIAQQNSTHRKNPNQYRVYDSKGLSPCLNKMDGGGREPHISMCIPVLTPDRAEKRQNGRRFKDNGDEAFTLTAQDIHGVAIGGIYTEVSKNFQKGVLKNTARANKASKHDNGVMLEVGNNKADIPVIWYEKYKCYIAIRKLTPRECFRLQGWADDYFDKAQFVNSDSQLYKQAGNAITVTVMEDIGRRLYEISLQKNND
jgi:DNA (cytosine-5)-methyltransferase 1